MKIDHIVIAIQTSVHQYKVISLVSSHIDLDQLDDQQHIPHQVIILYLVQLLSSFVPIENPIHIQ